MASDVKLILDGATREMNRARLSASRVSRSSDLLYALPIATCGLTDEAIRVVVGLCLGLTLRCTPLSAWHNSPLHVALTKCHAKAAQVVPPATISTTPYEELLNVPMFRQQKSQRAQRRRKASRRLDPSSLAKWLQPDTGSHSYGHPGKLLHAYHISEQHC